jgi:hypothetical protein
MSKLSRSVFGGLLFAFWLMCFVFPVSLIMSFSDHTPIGAFLVQQVIDFFFLWFVCGAVAHGVNGMFDDLNKRRPQDHNDKSHNDKSHNDESHNDKSRNDKSRNDKSRNDQNGNDRDGTNQTGRANHKDGDQSSSGDNKGDNGPKQ